VIANLTILKEGMDFNMTAETLFGAVFWKQPLEIHEIMENGINVPSFLTFNPTAQPCPRKSFAPIIVVIPRVVGKFFASGKIVQFFLGLVSPIHTLS
jgi:hypothetical protein